MMRRKVVSTIPMWHKYLIFGGVFLTVAAPCLQLSRAPLAQGVGGEAFRNDITWRREWVDRLRTAEETFHHKLSSAAPPYTLVHLTELTMSNMNYQAETADLSFTIHLRANREWFMEMNRELQEVKTTMDSLNATGRKGDWGLGKWPEEGVTDANPFLRGWRTDMTIVFELVDQQGRVVGRQSCRLTPEFRVAANFRMDFSGNVQNTVTFRGVNANDIGERMTVRPATVNDNPAASAGFAITAMTGSDFLAEAVKIEMVSVKGGAFTMGCTPEQGSDCFDNEKPSHRVTVGDFHIGKYEVTQRLWWEVTGKHPSYFEGDNLPVESVSWDDIQEFITKLNLMTGKKYRLPTEAEWEYAARGGSRGSRFKYSGSNTLGDVGWYYENSGDKRLSDRDWTDFINAPTEDNLNKIAQNLESNKNRTRPVGTKRANALGIHDMSGNVWEWVQDRYGEYTASSKTNPTGAERGSSRVSRGGGWNDNARICRVSYRFISTPGYRDDRIGFRLVLSP